MVGKERVKSRKKKASTEPFSSLVDQSMEIDSEEDSMALGTMPEEIEMESGMEKRSELQKRHHEERRQLKKQIELLKRERLRFNKRNPEGKRSKQNISNTIKKMEEDLRNRQAQELNALLTPKTETTPLLTDILTNIAHSEVQVHFGSQTPVVDFSVKSHDDKKHHRKKLKQPFKYVSRPMTSKAAEDSMTMSIEKLDTFQE